MARLERSPVPRTLFEHVISVAEADTLKFLATPELSGKFEGNQFILRKPPLIERGHDFVRFLEIQTPDGSTLSYVAKLKPHRFSLDSRYKAPFSARDLVPKQYAGIGNWVIEEKLEGIEEKELRDKLKKDEMFRDKYAKSVFTFIIACSFRGLRLSDVRFVNGHNCIIDPNTLNIKLIEQSGIFLYPYFKPNELVTEQLFEELDAGKEEPESWKIKFLMELVRLITSAFSPEDIHLRRRRIKPTHTDYQKLREFMFLHKRLKLPDNESIPYYGDGFTQVLSTDLVEAVMRNNEDDAKRLIESGEYKVDLTDKSDPRFVPIILPDHVRI